MTAEQNRLNLRSAERLAAAALGLDPDSNAELTYEERIQFSKRLAAVVLLYPAQFTAETLATAARISTGNYPALEAPGATLVEVTAAIYDASPIPGLVTLGEGVNQAVGTVGRLLPWAAAAAVAVLLWKLSR